jgi:G:T-mismatch repair DNA endonuclease (very short patch repair protein)
MARIQKYQGMNVDDLRAAAEKEEGKMRAAEEKFEAEVAKLLTKYGLLFKEKDDAIAGIKAAGLGLLKSVLKSKN